MNSDDRLDSEERAEQTAPKALSVLEQVRRLTKLAEPLGDLRGLGTPAPHALDLAALDTLPDTLALASRASLAASPLAAGPAYAPLGSLRQAELAATPWLGAQLPTVNIVGRALEAVGAASRIPFGAENQSLLERRGFTGSFAHVRAQQSISEAAELFRQERAATLDAAKLSGSNLFEQVFLTSGLASSWSRRDSLDGALNQSLSVSSIFGENASHQLGLGTLTTGLAQNLVTRVLAEATGAAWGSHRSAFEGWLAGLERLTQPLAPTFPVYAPEDYEEEDRKLKDFILEAAQRGWMVFPLILQLTLFQIRELAQAWREAGTHEEREVLMLDYCEKVLDKIVRSIKRALDALELDGQEERKQLLEQAVWAYREGHYGLVPGSLLTQAEGVAISFWREKVYDQSSVSRGTRIDKIFSQKYISTFLRPVKRNLSSEKPDAYSYLGHSTAANLDALQTVTVSFSEQFNLYTVEQKVMLSRHRIQHYGTAVNHKHVAMKVLMYYANMALILENIDEKVESQLLN